MEKIDPGDITDHLSIRNLLGYGVMIGVSQEFGGRAHFAASAVLRRDKVVELKEWLTAWLEENKEE